MEIMGIYVSFWDDLTEGERKRAKRNLAKWQCEEEKFRAACELDGIEEVLLWHEPDDYVYRKGITTLWALGEAATKEYELDRIGSAWDVYCDGMFTDDGYIYPDYEK